MDLVYEKSNWGTPLPANWGRGIAIAQSFGSIVAEVAEVEVGIDGKVKVHRVVCVVDPGFAIHPNGFIAQMESGIIYGLAAAMTGEITIENGAVAQSNFHNYRIIRHNEAPKEIDVHFIQNNIDPTGLGEPPFPPVFGAVANALYKSTGKRFYNQPFSSEMTKS